MQFRRLYSTGLPKSLTVIGGGQMGLGIAYVAAANARIPVTVVDNNAKSLEKGSAFVDKLLAKNVAKSRITEAEAKEIKSRFSMSLDLKEGVAKADAVVEAAPENVDLKLRMFEDLAAAAPKHALLGTNTSSISITKIAAAAKGAEDRVIGTHFMNPVPVQKGVEIIRGLQTSEETYTRALEFVKALKKITSSSLDSPGFLANRMLIPYINEAVMLLETGVGGKEDIDGVLINGAAFPMGPLALADFIGLDTCLAIMRVLYTETCDSKYRPTPLLAKMVDAGYLGVKSGKGFYDYSKK